SSDLVPARQQRPLLLYAQPVGYLLRQRAPARPVGKHGPHFACQIGGKRKLAASVGGHHRVLSSGGGHIRLVLPDAFETQRAPGEEEGVARRESLEEIFLHLP